MDGCLVVMERESSYLRGQVELSRLSVDDPVDQVAFSPDSQYLCWLSHNSVQVRKARDISDSSYLFSMEDKAAGIVHFQWNPNSQSLLAFSDFHLKVTVLQIFQEDGPLKVIRQPKHPERGCSFIPSGQFMAMAERRECRDCLGIYHSGDSYRLIEHFPVDTNDLHSLEWSADGTQVLVWDSPLEYKLLVYSPVSGLMAKFHPYEYQLGLR